MTKLINKFLQKKQADVQEIKWIPVVAIYNFVPSRSKNTRKKRICTSRAWRKPARNLPAASDNAYDVSDRMFSGVSSSSIRNKPLPQIIYPREPWAGFFFFRLSRGQVPRKQGNKRTRQPQHRKDPWIISSIMDQNTTTGVQMASDHAYKSDKRT